MAALEVSVHGVGGLMNSFDGAYSLVAHKSAIEPKALFPHAAKRSWPPDGRGGGGRTRKNPRNAQKWRFQAKRPVTNK